MRRTAAVSVILIGIAAARVHAQALDSDFVYGRDYTFERRVATRDVRDARDSGRIQLVTYVYRPLKNDRREVVLFSHGSTGGMITGPKEPGAAPAPPVIRFFVSRGYTLVAPLRRGRSESTGTYVEECSVFAGECTVNDQVALAEGALREALLDTNAVIEQVINKQLGFGDTRIIAAGHSRGGFLSLLLAAEHPQRVKAVVNFSGGWHGITNRLGAAENKARMDDHARRLTRAAGKAKMPSFWLYAARDPLYLEGTPQALVEAWRGAGGLAEFIYAAEHELPNPHLTPQAAALWTAPLDKFLKALDANRR
jgi:pimeloyl-ACP methyl ester carboxylesterase